MDEAEKTTESLEQPPEGGLAGDESPKPDALPADAVEMVTDKTEEDEVVPKEAVTEEAEIASANDPPAEAAETEGPPEEKAVTASGSGPLEEFVEDDDQILMDWYILKVQSNRENTICDALRRRVAVAGLDEYFGDIMVPTEDVAEFKNGKKKVVKRKLYPGYIVAHMSINDDTWFLVRETPGIGDFTGSQGKPSPMLKHEVDRIVKSANPDEEDSEQIKTAIPFKLGDRVRIKEGTFENFEGDVDGIDEANGRVTVMISIFGRTTPFEAEHWQIEAI
jgi:transcriptional antiterminator NusG